MIILTGIEMDVLKCNLRTGKNDRNIESMSESRFIVDAAPSAIFSLGKVSNQKPGTANLGDNLIIDFIVVRFIIYLKWFVPRRPDSGGDSILSCRIQVNIVEFDGGEPHLNV